uniref:PiggyBac transposable element-derived protein domain-containing protein n=1 Tax=Clastoptera arizonana TaxID=38151 RepID=A0A1B6CGV3_9HEMI
MGLNYKNNLTHYWATTPSQRVAFFPETISLNRFQLIRSMFYITSKIYIPKGQPGHDPWYKVRQYYDSMNRAFKQYFVPNQNLSLDESMIGMKNRCTFIQYMANKRHARFGIKKFELCDSQTSYVLHSEIYSGKGFLEDDFPSIGG